MRQQIEWLIYIDYIVWPTTFQFIFIGVMLQLARIQIEGQDSELILTQIYTTDDVTTVKGSISDGGSINMAPTFGQKLINKHTSSYI